MTIRFIAINMIDAGLIFRVWDKRLGNEAMHAFQVLFALNREVRIGISISPDANLLDTSRAFVANSSM